MSTEAQIHLLSILALNAGVTALLLVPVGTTGFDKPVSFLGGMGWAAPCFSSPAAPVDAQRLSRLLPIATPPIETVHHGSV